MRKGVFRARRKKKLPPSPLIGILDIQGSVEEHAIMLEKCGVIPVFVKNIDDLMRVKGLIIPGGESTHIKMMLEKNGLFDAIKKRVSAGLPVFGTCAGTILLAKNNLNAIDIKVKRNAYGRQLESFEADVRAPALGKQLFHAIFIRAPKILAAGRDVQILAKMGDTNSEIVLCRQKNVLVSTFHPELTGDSRLHKYFMSMLKLA